MTERGRRLPWVLWGALLLLLVPTLTLTVLNDSFEAFVAIAVAMMLGYGTMGALIASRVPGNPIGWLMLAIALGFVLTGLSEEYLTYAFLTDPGGLPFRTFVAGLTNWVFFFAFIPIPVVILLFPTGRVPSPRWRSLVIAIVALGAAAALGSIVNPGRLDIAGTTTIPNPTGVEGLKPLLDVLFWFTGLGLVAASFAVVVELIVRFRRSSGEERQQIRWIAYVSGLAAVLLLATLLTAVGLEADETRLANDALFYVFFACVGIALPAAMGAAILRYRLYDLDLVVKKTVQYAVLAAAFTAAAAIVLLAIPAAVIGSGDGGGSAVMPVVVLALAISFVFQPLRARARRLADRIVYGRRATPYEVLTGFSERVSETYSTEDVLPRMAQILAGGTGAQTAHVWLRVGRELRPAASWPPGEGFPSIPLTGDALPRIDGHDAFEVRHQGELLGALSVRMPANDPMDPAKEKLVSDLAAQAGLVLRNVRLIEELRASRQRLVAAQDVERRRIERNIHDGAQQQLVALSVKLRLADGMVDRDPSRAHELLSQVQRETNEALEELRVLARGIYPPLLADRGLAAALEAQARKMPVPITIQSDGVARYAQETETAVYFACLEALQNVAKYAQASHATVRLQQADRWLTFEVADDGRGFDPGAVDRGTGLQGMADRLEAIGGTLQVRSVLGSGTTVTGSLPHEPLAP